MQFKNSHKYKFVLHSSSWPDVEDTQEADRPQPRQGVNFVVIAMS